MDVPRRRSATFANAAKSITSNTVVVTNSHAVLASVSAMNVPRRRYTTLANAAKSIASD